MFGHALPSSLHCYEMVSDNTQFTTVGSVDDMQKGDLVWFGLRLPKVTLPEFSPMYSEDGSLVNWRDNPVKHVAIYTGEKTSDYMLLHATPIGGSTAVWPLRRFEKYKRYEKVYRISRLAIAQ